MKKLVLLGLIVLQILMLTSCISDAERNNGREDVKVGKKLIKDYVKENYGKKAQAKDFKPFYISQRSGSTVPNLSKVASGYVKATVSFDDTEFDILYNVYNNEVLTEENIDTVANTFRIYINEILQLNDMIDCDMELYSRIYEDYDIADFLRTDILTFQDLLALDEYSIDLTLRSINSDFTNISKEKWEELISSFLIESNDNNIEIVLVNYIDEDGYEAERERNYFYYVDSSTPYYKSDNAVEYTKNIVYLSSTGELEEYKGK